jgi:nucleoside-diphosphate-sugar epimerase
MPTALIVGGRGQCGLAIAQRLADDGWSVTATTSGAPPVSPPVPGVRWLHAQRTGLNDLAEEVKELDVVVHTTAYTVEDAEALIALQDRIGSAVVISTLSVYTDGAGRSLDGASGPGGFPEWPVPIREDQPLVPPGDSSYSSRKSAVEALLSERAPWPVTIVRPGAIHGRYGRHLREWYFVKRVLDRRSVVILPYQGRSTFQTTATTNLAELVRLAARHPVPAFRAFNCGDIDPPSVSEIRASVDDLMGWSTEQIAVAGPEPAPTVGNHPWAVPAPVIADMSRARAELGYEQPDTYVEAIAETIPWVVEACRDRDWRMVLPTLAGYPELFDYRAEDAYLDETRRESGTSE